MDVIFLVFTCVGYLLFLAEKLRAERPQENVEMNAVWVIYLIHLLGEVTGLFH
jgi:hypothetical protein